MAAFNEKQVTKRIFLALPAGEVFANELSPYLQSVSEKAPKWRWMAPDQIHITLHFLGAVPEKLIASAAEAVRAAAQSVFSFQICLDKTGCFPNKHAPRVFWASPEGDLQKIFQLQTQLGRILSEKGFLLDSRPYIPHATLARIPSNAPPLSIMEICRVELLTPLRVISKVVMYESILKSTGSRYEILEQFSLT